MKCPVCSSDLAPSRYEGLPVFTCDNCNGYLVATRRVTDIKRRRIQSPEDLKQEALVDGHGDSEDSLRCPRCRRRMDKELWKAAASFHIDKCRDCEFVWFDAGELARSQLDYEAKPRSQEALRFQDRHRQMTPEEKRQFAQDLARLPEGDATPASAFGAALMESAGTLALGLRRQSR